MTQPITPYTLFTCILAGTGGFMYGYDLVVAGGVSVMPDFQMKFYPSVYRAEKSIKYDNYCKYNNALLQLFTSSLYIAALVGSVLAGLLTPLRYKRSMAIAGFFYLAGTVAGAGAQHVSMVILARVLLGCGLGLANHAIPLYTAEMAPSQHRGKMGSIFGANLGVGVLSGNAVNYMAARLQLPWGWRLSMSLAGLPAITVTLASLILDDTPTQLLRRNKLEEAKRVLIKITGHDAYAVEQEYQEMVKAASEQQLQQRPPYYAFRDLFAVRQNRPKTVMAILIPFCQQFAGNDAILFYGAFLFKAAGLGSEASLYSMLVIGIVSLVAGGLCFFIVDRIGRRRILLVSSSIMLLCMVTVAVVFWRDIKPGSAQAQLSRAGSTVELIAVCLFVGSFSMSWGPMAWVVPSEMFGTHDSSVRSAGQSIVVFTNMLFKFVIAQTFLSMLCAFKYGIFLLFAAFQLLIILPCVIFLLPETNSTALHNMDEVWRSHPVWRHLYCAERGRAIQPQPLSPASAFSTP